jgi:lipopolysaccharide export system permease protein
MLFGILNRMIFWELVRVFLLALAALTGLFLIGGIIQQATQFGVSAPRLLRILPLLVPSSLPYTIPATVLFATCVVYGRLSHDNEAVALKAAGVDLLTMLRPAFLLGVLAAGGTAALEYALIPQTQLELHKEATRDPEETLYNLLKRERSFHVSNKNPSTTTTTLYVLYVRDVQDRRLVDVVVKRKTTVDGVAPTEGFDYVARTREAKLVIDTDANTLSVDSNEWVITGPKADIMSQDNKPFQIALPYDLSPNSIADRLKDRSQTIDWNELPERVAFFRGESEKALRTRQTMLETKPGERLTIAERNRIAEENGLLPAQVPVDPEERTRQVGHFGEVSKFFMRTSRTMEWEYHSRPAFAVGCLFFALIGCPIGIWANRADYLSMFVIGFLPAIFVYYPLVMAGGGLARDGKLPMAIGVWAADMVAAVAGIVLMWRLIRR